MNISDNIWAVNQSGWPSTSQSHRVPFSQRFIFSICEGSLLASSPSLQSSPVEFRATWTPHKSLYFENSIVRPWWIVESFDKGMYPSHFLVVEQTTY